MKVLVDADACPVTDIVMEEAKKRIDKSPLKDRIKASYKECARDKLEDRTATCIRKVLKLER